MTIAAMKIFIAAMKIFIGVCMKIIENWDKDKTNPSNPINKFEPAEKESSDYDLFDCKLPKSTHIRTFLTMSLISRSVRTVSSFLFETRTLFC